MGFHPVWSGIPLVLTLFGDAQVLKALLYFVFPAYGLRKMQIPTEDRAALFVVSGVTFVAIAGVLAFHIVTTA